MIYVYYTQIGSQLTDARFKTFLDQLPRAIQEQVQRYRKWEDRQRGLFGKLLLQRALYDLDLQSYTLGGLKYNSYNRPYFDHSVDFNISHSGDYVICAISKEFKVGCDIEKIQEVPISDFTEQFSEKELDEIVKNKEPLRHFFRLWAQKEAFLKVIGVGLNVPLHTLAITDNVVLWEGQEWFLHKLDIDEDYPCYVCTNSIFRKINSIDVIFN